MPNLNLKCMLSVLAPSCACGSIESVDIMIYFNNFLKNRSSLMPEASQYFPVQ